MRLHPLEITEHVRETYLRYLATVFFLRDRELRLQLEKALQAPAVFVKGPYLEATLPYKTGKTINQLIKEGLLTPEFDRLSQGIPMDRPLYVHQETALHKIIRLKRNLVVATGTGSGKTEAFLYPIFDCLLRQYKAGDLCPGVRALLLYPMNALANDQMKRLRLILKDYPFITFGRYTGETEQTRSKAEQHFRRNFPREPMIENELLSREEMREKPPHILLTNYAMLEYLLLRPKDCVFFDVDADKTWKFIILDEAHTYKGAKGIELAMLLRRLKDRVVRGRRGMLRCVATSATLGGGQRDYPAVAGFARNLFDEEFEWVEDQPDRQDVVEATRYSLEEYDRVWGRPEPGIYRELMRAVANKGLQPEKIRQLAGRWALPKDVVEEALRVYNAADDGEALNRFLYCFLSGDGNLNAVRKALWSSRSLTDVAMEVFNSGCGDKDFVLHPAEARESLIALVDMAVRARPGATDLPLLPARYHLFARALEGAYVGLWPEKKLFLEARKVWRENGVEVPVFELGTCKRCGHEFLIGRINADDKLVQCLGSGVEDFAYSDYFQIQYSMADSIPDEEDEEVINQVTGTAAKYEVYELCAACGDIRRQGELLDGPCCGHASPKSKWRLLRLVTPKGKQMRCPACGSYAYDLVTRFLTGQDAPTSVLATALYQKIPPQMADADMDAVIDGGASGFWETDEFMAPAVTEIAATREEHGRKLLVFSDSRQDAAFFACYLNRTYEKIIWRRLIVKVLLKQKAEALRLNDLVDFLVKEARDAGLFAHSQSKRERIKEAYRWAMAELLALDRNHSLEGLGLVRFSLVRPPRWQAPSYFVNRLGMTQEETWQLYEIMLNSFRLQGAVTFPDEIGPDDEVFSPRNRPVYFREMDSSPENSVLAWLPKGKKQNTRLDYLIKLLKKKNAQADDSTIETEAKKILSGIWRSLMEQKNIWGENYFRVINRKDVGVVYQLKYQMWDMSLDNGKSQWYRCSDCGGLFSLNLYGVCPRYRCAGELLPCDPVAELNMNHYGYLYYNAEPIPMMAEEHTAQLTGEAAAELQEKFVLGKVNVLSCSTTFEMGVDVGELETVFMRNMPPETSNYVQRAGRAGRRTDSTAFSLTFAQRRSHDLNFYARPENMIAGEIKPPYFELRNEKIILRHCNATALAMFFREQQEYYGSVENFYRPEEDTGGCAQLGRFLSGKPRGLLESLRRIVPKELQQQIGINDWRWVQRLLSDEGSLTRSDQEVKSDLMILQEELIKNIQQGKDVDHIQRAIRTIKRKDLLGFLSSRNVLPKYGFPVDVVELQITHHGAEAGKLQLERDLRIAIGEYSPGSEIVAGGRLWKSTGLKRVAKLEWPVYYYTVCEECGRYQRFLTEDSSSDTCIACNNPLGNKYKFVEPIFGFVTGGEKPGVPGESRPGRGFSSRVYFSDYEKETGVRSGEAREGQLTMGSYMFNWRYSPFGKLAVINKGPGGAGFNVCNWCGYAEIAGKRKSKTHKRPYGGKDCNGSLGYYHLGHEFISDVFELRIEGLAKYDDAMWLSVLYAVLEGVSEELAINRGDIDGCLYYYASSAGNPALIIYDDVPGGAGHVKRIGDSLPEVIRSALRRIDGKCGCAPETSCYGCLRNYRNQYCHDLLSRGRAYDFLCELLDG
ncbi:MAG: putative ATP-dependent helicase Lhr [Pelotomaculum sp. PtaB.Bin104]|nr:MAG: putative ATP-dependent helicase Lhr [Pelotomaculum sp. PtaB.Bin104]